MREGEGGDGSMAVYKIYKTKNTFLFGGGLPSGKPLLKNTDFYEKISQHSLIVERKGFV